MPNVVIDIDEDLKTKFKIKVAEKNTSQREVILNAIQEFVK